MAEDIIFSLNVDGDGTGAKSLKTLRQEFKALQSELDNAVIGTDEYRKTLEKLGGVKDEIKELNEQIDGFKGGEAKFKAIGGVVSGLAGGFAAAQGAAALFGAESEDLQKTLVKVQAAMALSQGVTAISELSGAFKVLGTVILANPIFALAAVVAAVSVAIISLTRDTTDYAKAQEDLNTILADSEKAQKEFNDRLVETQIELDVLTGKMSEYEASVLKIQKKGSDERTRLAEETSKKIFDLLADYGVETNKLRRDQNTGLYYVDLEGAGDRLNILAKLNEDLAKIQKTAFEANLARTKSQNNELAVVAEKAAIDLANQAAKINTDLYKQQIKDKEAFEYVLFEIEAMTWNDLILPHKINKAKTDVELHKSTEQQKREDIKKTADFAKAVEDELEKRKIARAAAEIQIEQNYFNAAQDLSATYFNAQLASVRGNVAEEEKLRRKQFQVNKAFAATRATIDAVNAVQGILAQSALYGPLTIPLAISTGVAAAANVAKILSTQYNSGGQGTVGNTNISSGGPQIQTQAPVINQPLTRLNEQGQNLNIKAYVVETEMTEKQNRVSRLESQASF